MRNEHLTNHKLKVKCLTSKNNNMGFLPLWCGPGLAKVNESECQQCLLVALDCRIMTLGLKTRSQSFV